MTQHARFLAAAIVLIACGDDVAGPKPASPLNAFVKVVSTVSKTSLAKGDTMTWTYSVENITNDSLTLTTPLGCQIQPELDQVDGAPMEPRPLKNLLCMTFDFATVSRLAKGEKMVSTFLIGGYAGPGQPQPPGYLLSTGTWDASMLVTANEIGGSARSDWVRFEVK